MASRMTVLTTLCAALLCSTAVHYTDNTIAFHSYPGSNRIAPVDVPVTWVVLTAIGAAGYVLYRRGRRDFRTHMLLGVYSLTGLTTLGHYLSGSPSELSALRNVSIMLDGVLGAALLGFVLWSWSARERLGAPVSQ